jgi:hypothetical protein
VSSPLPPPLRIAVIALAGASLAIGAWQTVSPRTFYDALGPFGAYNGHYVRDYASWSLAYGLVLLVALRRPAWAVPLIVLGLVQVALHALNHVLDAGEADPSWIGPFDALALGLTAVGLVLVLRLGRPEAVR